MRKPPLSLGDAEIHWLRSLSLSDAAFSAYRGEVGRFIAFCASNGVLAVRQLRASHWMAYVSCLTTDRTSISPAAKPLKPSSAVQAVRITRAFLLYCARRSWLNWEPAGVKLPALVEAPSVPAHLSVDQFPTMLRSVLRSECVAQDTRQARKHFALGIGFWGALAPREMALLQISDLRLPRGYGSCELHCAWRPVPVVLPAVVKSLWSRYRNLREEDCEQELHPCSPLIANLRTGAALHPWSVWALMRRDDADEDVVTPNSQLLRKAYFASTTRDATGAIDVVCVQAGKSQVGERTVDAEAHRSTIAKLHQKVLVQLAN